LTGGGLSGDVLCQQSSYFLQGHQCYLTLDGDPSMSWTRADTK